MPHTPPNLAAALQRIAYEANGIERQLPSISLAEIFAAIDGCHGDFEGAAKTLVEMHAEHRLGPQQVTVGALFYRPDRPRLTA
jgi:hypothetical protein